MAHLPLDRDVPSNDSSPSEPEDLSPVDVPYQFKTAIATALRIAKEACTLLSQVKNPKRSAVEFWCDMVDVLVRVEKDIEIVTDPDIERKI